MHAKPKRHACKKNKFHVCRHTCDRQHISTTKTFHQKNVHPSIGGAGVSSGLTGSEVPEVLAMPETASRMDPVLSSKWVSALCVIRAPCSSTERLSRSTLTEIISAPCTVSRISLLLRSAHFQAVSIICLRSAHQNHHDFKKKRLFLSLRPGLAPIVWGFFKLGLRHFLLNRFRTAL